MIGAGKISGHLYFAAQDLFSLDSLESEGKQTRATKYLKRSFFNLFNRRLRNVEKYLFESKQQTMGEEQRTFDRLILAMLYSSIAPFERLLS